MSSLKSRISKLEQGNEKEEATGKEFVFFHVFPDGQIFYPEQECFYPDENTFWQSIGKDASQCILHVSGSFKT